MVHFQEQDCYLIRKIIYFAVLGFEPRALILYNIPSPLFKSLRQALAQIVKAGLEL